MTRTELWWDFQPGQRVLTREGILGTVDAVEDGPVAGTESYLVTLDSGMGGGEYASSDLRAVNDATAKLGARNDPPTQGWDDAYEHAHTADADYPELAGILVERPPLEWTKPVPTRWALGQKAAPKTADVTDDRWDAWTQRHTDRALWYHGTNALLHPGDVIEPNAIRGIDSTHPGTYTRGDVVYVTSEPHLAERYAVGIAGREGGEPHVYEVRAIGAVQPDTEFVESGFGEDQAEATLAEVVREVPLPGGVHWENGAMMRGPKIGARIPVVDAAYVPPPVAKIAGIGDWLDQHVPEQYHSDPGRASSYDWCRFRRSEHCYYSHTLDPQGSEEAGYAVWTPEDRGYCPRTSWSLQKACPVSEPGPHSGEQHARVDATIPWEQGGQRGGHPGAPSNTQPWLNTSSAKTGALRDREGNDLVDLEGNELSGNSDGTIDVYHATSGDAANEIMRSKSFKNVHNDSRDDVFFSTKTRGGEGFGDHVVHARVPASRVRLDDAFRDGELHLAMPRHEIRPEHIVGVSKTGGIQSLGWHLTATWTDVRDKATRLVREGRVRIVSVPQRGSLFVTAEVQGDHGIYQTTLMRVPGKKSVATWECGCPWSTYSWGRSGRWKRLEGRMCSHALAVVYRAQQQEMFGGNLIEDVGKPRWSPTDVQAEDRNVAWPSYYEHPRAASKVATLRHTAALDDVPEEPPASLIAAGMLEDGYGPTEVIRWVEAMNPAAGVTVMTGALRLLDPITIRYRGTFRKVLEIDGTDLLLDNGETISFHDALYPTYDPRLGLDPRETSLHVAMGYDEAAEMLLAKARAEEPSVTAVMRRAADATGGELVGLDFRLKSRASLERKLSDVREVHTVDPELAADHIKDALRYTIIYAPDDYSTSTHDALRQIVASGLRVVENKNYWPSGDPYQGINVALETSGGLKVELQFHTDASLAAKEQGTHRLYERFRTEPSPTVRRGLWDSMVAIAAQVPIPSGVLGLGSPRRQQFASLEPMGEIDGPRYYTLTHPVGRDRLIRLVTEAGDARVELLDDDGGWTMRNDLLKPIVLGMARGAQAQHLNADGSPHTGVMVAFRPPEAIVDLLVALGSEDPSNVHVTLGYLGHAEDVDRETLLDAIGSFAATSSVLMARISGLGTFVNDDRGDEGNVLYASIDAPGLDALRVELVDHLAHHGLMVHADHGYIPHCTLAYSDTPIREIPELPRAAQQPWLINALFAAHGEEWVYFPLQDVLPSAVAKRYIPPKAAAALEEGAEEAAGDREQRNDDRSQAKPNTGGGGLTSALPMLQNLMGGGGGGAAAGEAAGGAAAAGGGEEAALLLAAASYEPPAGVTGREATSQAQDPPIEDVPGIETRAWLMDGGAKGDGDDGNGDIAKAARQFLASKQFSPAEQAALIDEGEGVTAANLDRLDIAGTHYEALAALDDDDPRQFDDTWQAI